MSRNDQEVTPAGQSSLEGRLQRFGGISYLHIPAVDVKEAAAFYKRAFGWNVHWGKPDRPGFTDGTGHVGGAWVTTQAISREPGFLPYLYAEDVDDTLKRIVALGGHIVQASYPEGNLWVATFRDPAGNLVGLWQESLTNNPGSDAFATSTVACVPLSLKVALICCSAVHRDPDSEEQRRGDH